MRKISLTILLSTLSFLWVNSQSVISATGGSGLYKSDIKWLNFADLTELAQKTGLLITKNFNVGDVLVTVEISDLSFTGLLANQRPLSEQRLVKYNSGKWVSDGLVRLYNIGVPNNGSSAADREKNTLFNALANKYDGNYSTNVTSKFTIKVYATLNGQPMDLGLVYASAEDDGIGSPVKYQEYTSGVTNGTPWQLLEKRIGNKAGLQTITFSADRLTAKTSCGYGNTAIMYTQKAKTTATAPLKVDVSMLSGGNSAVALGVLVNSDISDAPLSYGTPANISFYDISGGNPASSSTQTTYYLSANDGSAESKGGSPVLSAGTPVVPASSRLGNISGDADPADDPSLHSASANIDDNTGADDEDALGSVAQLNVNASSYTLQFSATSTPSSAAYITAWVDFNRDGFFSKSEYKSFSIAKNSTQNVSLTWSNLSSNNLKSGISYIRIRISSFDSENSDLLDTQVDERSTMALSGGETEDYKLEIVSSITGNVFHDANGLLGTPANTIDGILTSICSNTQLVMTLTNGNGIPVASQNVNNGAFSFVGPFDGSYKLKLTAVDISTGLPFNWVNIGEAQALTASSAASDGTPDGLTTITSAGKDVYSKFGIQQRPTANNQYLVINKKLATNTMYSFPELENMTQVPQLSGSDPEDNPSSSTDSISVGGKFTVTQLPAASDVILFYNGAEVTVGTTISNYDPARLQIKFLRTGVVSLEFKYAITDKADFQSLESAIYKIDLLTVLPVTGLKLSGLLKADKIQLHWQTMSEINTDYFDIEQSFDGVNYNKIGRIPASKNSSITSHYLFNLTTLEIAGTYYRIVLYDQDGQKQISNVVQINVSISLTLAPNPAKNYTIISGLSGSNNISIINSSGQILQSIICNNTTGTINTTQLPRGVYWVKVTQSKTVVKILKLIKD
jgi:hypothetical protein